MLLCGKFDHIHPFGLVDKHDRDALIKNSHWSNTQPLLIHENFNKGKLVFDKQIRVNGKEIKGRMKSAFTFNGQHYLSPSKKQARAFLKLYGEVRQPVYRYRTMWKLKHVERAPSYFKSMRVSSPVNYFVDI